jgi:hypothetical protein
MSSRIYDNTFATYYFFRNKINCFARHTTDEQFKDLAEIVTRRFYRSMVVNKDDVPRASSYMYALDDALNMSMGKAADYKIIKLDTQKKWHTLIFEKKSVLVIHDKDFIEMGKLLDQLRRKSNCRITVAADVKEIERFDLRNVTIIRPNEAESINADLTVITCYQILDFPYDTLNFVSGKMMLIDNYDNTLVDEGDLTICKNYESNYSVFHTMLYQFVSDKLNVIRNHYENESNSQMV